jgi:hypothetical protein
MDRKNLAKANKEKELVRIADSFVNTRNPTDHC